MRFSVYLTAVIPLLTFVYGQDTCLKEVKSAFEAANIPEDISITFDPTVLLEVTLPQTSGDSITLHAGVQVPREDTAGPPTFSIDPSTAAAAGPGPFVIAAIDPDAPTPQDPTNAQIRHFLGSDFTVNGGALTNSTPAISPFRQPTPPAGSDAHRYIFLLFNQPANFDEQTVVTSNTSTSLFNISAFAAATGLGSPIGGTFMLVAPAA
ncbi:hypothetical protein D9758_007092 [Tetrapyrgos nigripes]|uniref:PEBP-like protein n=1 Tax=Tetrapyrgos nigripes TaxID=182062 RepID=A0A8H5GDU0_9AGAR|nr:hypothetical protein D9758_007092 [Tetrapyrgos nigripes]